jgi:hypothetical protein
MAKDPTPTNETEVPAGDIALDNWCESKSRAVGRRVEALSAFYKLCQKQGIGRATPEKFEADFQAFLNSPA